MQTDAKTYLFQSHSIILIHLLSSVLISGSLRLYLNAKWTAPDSASNWVSLASVSDEPSVEKNTCINSIIGTLLDSRTNAFPIVSQFSFLPLFPPTLPPMKWSALIRNSSVSKAFASTLSCRALIAPISDCIINILESSTASEGALTAVQIYYIRQLLNLVVYQPTGSDALLLNNKLVRSTCFVRSDTERSRILLREAVLHLGSISKEQEDRE